MRIYREFEDQEVDKYIKEFKLFPINPDLTMTMTLWNLGSDLGQSKYGVYRTLDDSFVTNDDKDIILKIDTNSNFAPEQHNLAV